MFRKLKIWLQTPNRTRLVLIESVCVLAVAQIAVKFFFPRIAAWVMKPRADSDTIPPLELQQRVRRGIRVAAKNLPWKSVCLPNAIAAKIMLAYRGYASTIHLGVGTKDKEFMAHAWLDAGGEILTGQDGMDGLSTIMN